MNMKSRVGDMERVVARVTPPPTQVKARDTGPPRNSAVDRALIVLEAFLSGADSVGVIELAERVGLDKSVVHRILTTLVRRRFIEQDRETKKYAVGLRLWQLGQRYVGSGLLETAAMPVLRRLVAHRPYCMGYVGIPDGLDVVVLARVRGFGAIFIETEPGARYPMASTATGRALLAGMSDKAVERVLRESVLTQRTPESRVTTDAVRAALAETRRMGYAIVKGEYVPGVGSLAVGVNDPKTGEPSAGINISFPMIPEAASYWDEFPELILEAARELAANLEGGD